ncbi:hypothetical protein AXF19_00855 [Selenomonas sp. oral taxon 126]|nr:hypothetical protein AXF19_00855 [Selenomonas sp. oral taxon 126]
MPIYLIGIVIGIFFLKKISVEFALFQGLSSDLLIYLLVIDAAFTGLLHLYNARISLDYQYKKYLWMSLFLTSASMVLSVFFILFPFSDQRYMGRIWGGFLPLLCLICYIVYTLIKKAPAIPNYRFWRFGIFYSLPLIPHGLALVLMGQCDRIMIQHFNGAYDVGIYSLAANVSIILLVISQSLDSSWGVWFFEKMSHQRIEDIYHKSSEYIALFTAVGVLLIAAAPDIIRIMSSGEYWAAKDVVIVLLWGNYFSFLYLSIVHYEYFYNKTYLVLIGTVLSATLNVGLNYYTIPLYGYMAAAYTTLVSYVLNFLFHYVIIFFLYKHRPLNVYTTFLYIFYTAIAGSISLLYQNEYVLRYGIVMIILLLVYRMNYISVNTKWKKILMRYKNRGVQ